MADKLITDLQLRSEVTDECNFPVDDTIQGYRVTAAQLQTYILGTDSVTTAVIEDNAVTEPKIADDLIHALTVVTPLAGDHVAIADASDSNINKKALVSGFRNAVYRSVTSTDSVGADDETMKLSGSAFTSTLPTAVGVEGKRYKYIHAGTNFVAYTLATTSAQTIGGIASGSYKLMTTGEVLEIESDGANWIIVGRHTSNLPVTYTPATTGFGTISGLSAYWSRFGSFAKIRVVFTTGTTNGSTATVDLMGSQTSSSTYTSVSGANSLVGTWARSTAGAFGGTVLIQASATALNFSQQAGGVGGGSVATGSTIIGNTTGFTAEAMIQIADWQP